MATLSIANVVRDMRRASTFRRPSYINVDFLITRLPEKLILRVFSYLTHVELCTLAHVCKQWRRLAYEPSLWQSLNLRPEYDGIPVRSVDDLLNLIHNRSGTGLRRIELSSDLITVPVLEELGNTCPSLRSLTLDFSNAMQLHDFNELVSFPTSLHYLYICLSDVIFMEGLMRKIYPCLSPVEVLHLIGTFEQANEEEEEIYEYNSRILLQMKCSNQTSSIDGKNVILSFSVAIQQAPTDIIREELAVQENNSQILFTQIGYKDVITVVDTDLTEDFERHVINISKIKAHTPNLRVVNLYGIAFIEDSHVELLASNCIQMECLALNFCLNVKGACFSLLINNCTKVKTLLLEHCGLKDEFVTAAPWEKSNICELDITSTELSADCLESMLSRIPFFTYLAVGHSDFFGDNLLKLMSETGKFHRIKAIDLSYTPSLTEHAVSNFIRAHGKQIEGIMFHGKPQLAEYFWTTMIPCLPSLKICVLGAAHGWFFKYNTRVHIDKILEGFAAHCPNIEALEIQWDPATIRFSDKSRKFIDRFRIKCTRVKTLTLSDGKYYEMVKGNYERAERPRVVRTCTTFNTSIVTLISRFQDLRFN